MGMRTEVTDGLTGRQRQVLELIARGKTNFEVAQELGITLDGAKWHLREIMARFGCDTREEAVAIWQAQPSAGRRVVRRIARPLAFFGTGIGKAASVVAAGGTAAGIVALIALATGGGSEGGQPLDAAETEGAATVGVDSASQVTPIAFRSCGTATFERPTIAEMAEPFSVPRFNPVQPPPGERSERPGPASFAYYLTKFYEIYPHANSANVGTTAMGGSRENWEGLPLIPATQPCDEAFLQDYTISYYMFRFVDMVPEAVSLDGIELTVHVHTVPGSTTTVTFPEPAVSRPPSTAKDIFEGLPPFKELRVVGSNGALLFTRGVSGAAQYAPGDGSLEFATNAFGGSAIAFEIRGRPQIVVAYASSAGGAAPARVVDAAGNTTTSDPLEAAPNTWAETFRKELSPGRYLLQGAGSLVVPVGTALP